MIEVLPVKDRQREAELLKGVGLKGGKPAVMMMTERGKELGWVALELDGNVLRILKMTAAGYDFSRKPQGDEIFVLDTLMRSAASYGETFGADYIESSFPDFYGFFAARGFDTDESHVYTPMSTIVHYDYQM